jgi:hypothetical protein
VASTSSLYFDLKTVGSSFISFKYNSIRVLNSCFEVTRMPRSRVRAKFPKNDSTRLSHDPCWGSENELESIGHAHQVAYDEVVHVFRHRGFWHLFTLPIERA